MFTPNCNSYSLAQKLTGFVLNVPKSCTLCSLGQTGYVCFPQAKIKIPKRGSRNLRKQGTKSRSGDPKLDALRANLVVHDAKLQMEAGKQGRTHPMPRWAGVPREKN
ncbi:hypothetical protein Hanom_Chr12g01095781 [Helianthus anomalus]